MRLSDFQNKDIIDVITGDKLGNIIDVDVDMLSGLIKSLIIYNKKKPFSFKLENEIEIKWNQIKKIGNDTILIEKK